jgi:hypothetical protein
VKALSFTKYIYLIVAALSIFKITELWNIGGTELYLYIGFAVASLFMFFFRRHYEKKFEDYKKDK